MTARFPVRGLLAALLWSLCAQAAAADCIALDRLGSLTAIGRSVAADPTARNRTLLRRSVEAMRRSGVSGPVAEHLSFLATLAQGAATPRAEVERRLAETSRFVRVRANALECGGDSSRLVATASTAEGRSRDGSGAAANDRPAVEAAGLTVLGAGAAAVPMLLLPAGIAVFRKRKVRRTTRHPARYETVIRFGRDEFPCMVINVSRGGVGIVTSERLPRGRSARIDLPDGAAEAEVRWRTEYQMGLAFATPLDEASVKRIQPA